jgi:hypothetical protein
MTGAYSMGIPFVIWYRQETHIKLNNLRPRLFRLAISLVVDADTSTIA